MCRGCCSYLTPFLLTYARVLEEIARYFLYVRHEIFVDFKRGPCFRVAFATVEQTRLVHVKPRTNGNIWLPADILYLKDSIAALANNIPHNETVGFVGPGRAARLETGHPRS